MTDLLFAMPSLQSGIASCIDLFGVFNIYNDFKENPDKRALLADYLTIKNDFDETFKEIVCSEQKS